MTGPRTFQKKPVRVQAIPWTGDNVDELDEWTDGGFEFVHPGDRHDNPDATGQLWVAANNTWLPVVPGEWIIRDASGFYPCQPDRFTETYQQVIGL